MPEGEGSGSIEENVGVFVGLVPWIGIVQTSLTDSIDRSAVIKLLRVIGDPSIWASTHRQSATTRNIEPPP